MSYLMVIGCFFLVSIANAQTKSTPIILLSNNVSNNVIFLLIECTPRDCKELYEQGERCSGVYAIKPDDLPAFKVNTILLETV